MNTHYTGRQLDVTPEVREQVESRLEKLKKILGPRPAWETHVTLSQVRHRHAVEISVNLRDHAIVGAAETPDLNISLNEALDKIEKQAVKHKARLRAKKRHAGPQDLRSIRTLPLAG